MVVKREGKDDRLSQRMVVVVVVEAVVVRVYHSSFYN